MYILMYLMMHFGPRACPHAMRQPNWPCLFRSPSMCTIQLKVYIHSNRFGGGPVVPKLEVCSTCRALLDNYSGRRKKEKDDVYKVGTFSFVVCTSHR